MGYDKRNLKPKFLKQFEKNRGLVYITCKQVGISPTTFSSWRKNDAEFDEAINQILEEQLDKGESKLLDELEKENPNAQLLMFYLRTKGKNRGYGESMDVTTNGNDVNNIPTINISVIKPKNEDEEDNTEEDK